MSRITWPRVVAALTGLSLGVCLGISLTHEVWAAPVFVALDAVIAALLIRALVPEDARPRVAKLIAFAIAVRVATAAVIWAASLAAGLEGFVTGDDVNYAALSWGVIHWFRGDPVFPYIPPSWAGEDYLLGTFVYFEMAVFFIFGPQPVLVEILNAGMAAAAIVLVYDLTRRILGPRAALVSAFAFALWPSQVLWSALNLKDAMTLLIVALFFWTLARLQERPRWPLLLGVFVLLIPLETLRRYLYTGLAILLPLMMIIAPRLRLVQRALWTGLAVAATLALIAMQSKAGPGVPTQGVSGFEQQRAANAEGARTAYVGPKPVLVPQTPTPQAPASVALGTTSPGATKTPAAGATQPARTTPPAATALASPGPTAATPTLAPPPPVEGPTYVVQVTNPCPEPPSRQARLLYVSSGTLVVLESGPSPTRVEPGTSGVISVVDGDVLVYGPDDYAPQPRGQWSTLGLRCLVAADTAQFVPVVPTGALTITRTLAYLPKGAAYAFLSPFPWDLGRLLDYLTIPEMLVWYVVLLMLPFSLWRVRDRWRLLAPMLAFFVGVMGLLVLTEGNYGTLYRHRAMVIPFAVALASPGLLALWLAVRARFSPRVPAPLARTAPRTD